MRGRRRTRVIAAIVSPLLFLALVEGILQLAGYRYVPYADEQAVEDWHLPAQVYQRHPVLLWTLPPNSVVDRIEKGFRAVKTNRLGLRGPLPDGPRRPGEIRVLCLGDSVTFGLGLEDSQSWPDRLAAHLSVSPDLAGRPVTVLNGAVPGWSSVQGMRLLEELDWFEPDFVVFWFGMNDIQLAWGRPDSRKGASPGVLDDVVSALARLRTVQLLSSVAESARGGGEETRASVEDFRSAVARLRDLEAAGGPRTIFVRVPEQLERTESQLAAVIARMEQERVSRVLGPHPLLNHILPMPGVTRINGSVRPGPAGLELCIPGPKPVRQELSELRGGLRTVRIWEKTLAERLALLPEGSPGAEEMFGDAPPDSLFLDNCHLTAEGSDLAGRALARRIIELLGE